MWITCVYVRNDTRTFVKQTGLKDLLLLYFPFYQKDYIKGSRIYTHRNLA